MVYNFANHFLTYYRPFWSFSDSLELCEFLEVLCFLQPLNHFLTFVTPLCLLIVSVGGDADI